MHTSHQPASSDEANSSPEQRRRWNPWPWVPVFVILTATIPSTIMVTLSTKRSTDPVVAAPYQAAEHFDRDRSAMQRWQNSGLRLQVEAIGPQRLRIRVDQQQTDGSWAAAELTDVTISQYRSDSGDHDQTWSWDKPRSPELVDVPLGGSWRFGVRATLDDEMVQSQVWIHDVAWR